MESKAINSKKIEEIQKAIQQLVEFKQASSTKTSVSTNDDEQQLLAKLLSQLESLKQDEVTDQAEVKEVVSGSAVEVENKGKDQSEICTSNTGVGAEDVAKQLKKVEKQNRTTHWLLSALIVLTIAWQVSEVSLLIMLKDGVSHPFKSVGNIVGRWFKRTEKREEKAEQKSLLAKVNGSEKSENSLELPSDLSGLINADQE